MDKKILVLLILLVMLSSCTMSPEKLKAKIIEANSNIKSYESDMMMILSSKMELFGQTIESDTSMDSQAKVDVENKKMYMIMTMDAGILGEIETETYVVDDKIYTKSFEQWMVDDYNSELGSQNDKMSENIDYLASGKVKLQQDVIIDGQKHYVIIVEPDLALLAESIDNEQLQEEDIDLEEMFSEYSLTYWINKKTFIISKVKIEYKIEMDNIVMDSLITMTYENINDPVDIEIPLEAENAQSMNDMFGDMEDLFGDMDDEDLSDYEDLFNDFDDSGFDDVVIKEPEEPKEEEFYAMEYLDEVLDEAESHSPGALLLTVGNSYIKSPFDGSANKWEYWFWKPSEDDYFVVSYTMTDWEQGLKVTENANILWGSLIKEDILDEWDYDSDGAYDLAWDYAAEERAQEYDISWLSMKLQRMEIENDEHLVWKIGFSYEGVKVDGKTSYPSNLDVYIDADTGELLSMTPFDDLSDLKYY